MTDWKPAAGLVPHTGAAVLLDMVHDVDAKRLLATLVVRPETAFSDSSGSLPAWVAPEIMAQAIAAKSSSKSLREKGRPAAIGLLLGVRDFRAAIAAFYPGDLLEVEVTESLDDGEGMAVFDGEIRLDGRRVASGVLTVFQAEDDSVVEQEAKRHA